MPNAQSILQKKGADVATVDRKNTVLDAAKTMNQRRIGAVVVTDGDRVVGIFTERDILSRIVAAGKDPKTARVEEVMTSPMACCQRDTRLTECRTVMTQKRIRHLPVVEDGKLYGIISAGDILAGEVADQQATIEYLHEYLYGRT
jgi:CBS domain-containing protein